jgi:hypothetical protein
MSSSERAVGGIGRDRGLALGVTSVPTPAVRGAMTGCMCTVIPGVVCNAIADNLDGSLPNIAGFNKVARCVCAIDFEALV